ncbi:MAG: MBL fold metallo-hydrolase [Firmicutes bacterium]|nr:MBL fold metallo-hydrolase [Bacillota bacterium]
MDLKFKIMYTNLKYNEIALFWLGQAGFLIKDSDGNIIVVDPYLTDCGERLKGFKRLSPKLISPNELQSDIYISTHTHFDHFDYDAIPIVASCSKTNFYGPKSCVEEFRKIGIKGDRIKLLELGKEARYKNITIKAAYADHGTLAPDAIGLMLDINGIRLYFSGDTAFHPEKLEEVKKFQPHIAILSVNGRFGNLNSSEGAKLVEIIEPDIVLPCHFWTFMEHGGDPQFFGEEVKKCTKDIKVKFLAQGEMLKYKR